MSQAFVTCTNSRKISFKSLAGTTFHFSHAKENFRSNLRICFACLFGSGGGRFIVFLIFNETFSRFCSCSVNDWSKRNCSFNFSTHKSSRDSFFFVSCKSLLGISSRSRIRVSEFIEPANKDFRSHKVWPSQQNVVDPEFSAVISKTNFLLSRIFGFWKFRKLFSPYLQRHESFVCFVYVINPMITTLILIIESKFKILKFCFKSNL